VVKRYGCPFFILLYHRAYLGHVIASLHAGGADPDKLTPLALAKRFPVKKQ